MTVFIQENERIIVETVREIFNVEILSIKVGLKRGTKSNCVVLLKSFIQCFEHAECIAIDIFDVLGNE